MAAATEDVDHPTRTRRGCFRYCFTAKHHGGDAKAATWLRSVSRDEEFSIFDLADQHEIVDDERQRMYGVLRDEHGKLRKIGTKDEQVAEFQPGSNREDAWHGYPAWPIGKESPTNRKHRPNVAVFNQMLSSNLITTTQRKKLLKGKNA